MKDDSTALLKQNFKYASPWNGNTHYEMQVLAFIDNFSVFIYEN